jgi:hypothetical protein
MEQFKVFQQSELCENDIGESLSAESKLRSIHKKILLALVNVIAFGIL